jgi:hypothetical protein
VSGVKRGGLLLRVDGELRFVSASVAIRVGRTPRVTGVPGGPEELLGIAVHGGAVVPVVAVGKARGEMIVCQYAGELVGIVGGEVVRSGTFDAVPDRPDLVEVDGERIRPLDVGAVYSRVQAGARPGRWSVR